MNNISNLDEKKWSGGITRELYRDCVDFNIRISCAEIYPGESFFSDFTGYKRVLKILENNVTLERNNTEKIFLDKTTVFIFDGSDKISSTNKNIVLDFNIIYKPNFFHVSFEEIDGFYYSIGNHPDEGKVLIFSTSEDSILTKNKCNLKLNKYDFLILDYSTSYSLNGKFIIVKFKNNKKL